MFEIQDHSIHSVKYQNSARGMIRFELISLYGRILLNKKPRLTGNLNLLHLGCSRNRFAGWVNADFYQGLKFWKKHPNQPDWILDLRYPLNCDSNYWDGVFTEHALEHLLPLHALNLLKQISRILKPGCWLRVSVPDLEKYVDYYCRKKSHENFKRWPTGAEAIRSLTQNWGHLSVWDSELLGNFLDEAGFVNIKKDEHKTPHRQHRGTNTSGTACQNDFAVCSLDNTQDAAAIFNASLSPGAESAGHRADLAV